MNQKENKGPQGSGTVTIEINNGRKLKRRVLHLTPEQEQALDRMLDMFEAWTAAN